MYGILAFALLFLLSTIFFGSISLGEDIKVIKDFGLAGIYIFSLIITIFLGTSLIYKELEKRTLYIILSKPVSPLQFILGKFFGLWCSIIINVALMTIVHLVVVYIKGGGFDLISLWSILLLMFELAIFIALTILFSTITAPLAGAIYSLIVLYMGHSMNMVRHYGEQASKTTQYFTKVIYYILPNLEKFNIRNNVVHNVSPTSSEIIYPIVYGVLYSVVIIWLATLALKKQDL